MILEDGVKLDFCDVLLKPKRSTIESRKDVSLERTFEFRWSCDEWTGIPIISSNMTSVTTPEVAVKMVSRKMLACLPKTNAMSDSLPGDSFKNFGFTIPSVGLEGGVCPTMWVAVDVPNGYMEAVVDFTEKLRNGYGDSVILIVGNVVTAEQTEALILAGADIVKVGIGSGAACSTRIKTGVGMPQLSAIIDCAEVAHGLGGHIISDGGASNPGDIMKAFAGGADFVMLGSMLSGCLENGTDFYGMSSKRANNEFSGGLKDYRASEGWEMKVPNKGPIDNVLQDIEGGLRSGMSYIGAKTIKEISKRATFVQVNRQANTRLWDYRV